MESLNKTNTSAANAQAASLQDLQLYEVRHTLHLTEVTMPAVSQLSVVKTQLVSPLSNKFNFLIKRSLDVLLSLFLIVFVLSWLTPIIAILIKLDSKGPVFFRQRRNKNLGKIFTCIKFRTMIVNADADILSSGISDKRITRFGHFLRKHHFDELPQLLNVLIGDMSVIGPRPHMVMENSKFEEIVADYESRHAILPGITGLAQSYGNFGASEDIDMVKQRVELDLHYIRNWSLLMDIKILLRTGKIIFRL